MFKSLSDKLNFRARRENSGRRSRKSIKETRSNGNENFKCRLRQNRPIRCTLCIMAYVLRRKQHLCRNFAGRLERRSKGKVGSSKRNAAKETERRKAVNFALRFALMLKLIRACQKRIRGTFAPDSRRCAVTRVNLYVIAKRHDFLHQRIHQLRH